MGWTYAEYLRQPAAIVIRWKAMLAAESRASQRRREVEESKAKGRK